MLLSASYNYFNGEEHLLASLRSIANSVEHVSIVYQATSNSGEPISEEALDALSDAIGEKLVNDVSLYEPDLTLPRSVNERNKRNWGLKIAKLRKSTHFMTMDVDEFYRETELISARRLIAEHGYNSTSAASFFHLKSPRYRSKLPDSTNVSLITKIEPWSKFRPKQNYYIPMVDPTRNLKTLLKKHHHFSIDCVAMYHMNLVRRDIDSKFRNTSTTDNKFLDSLRKNIDNWNFGTPFEFPNKGMYEIAEVENEFNTFDN
ncbi:hypothetical protein GCM10007094_00440 [Pseudovibrio japonicus]|uniref:Uncharacterized protein n=1 Tax=Pseudovibrio japonicus TaxID=366534 RepID=A0ABQ3DVH6_9HYPH|nr:hypothetical protein [Pseudovibrio japonicus]GHB16963.1 hypothetical protein GCM10007094_00440 [Pseudovibrio japonicus]